MLVAGIAGFKSGRPIQNPSARFLRDWLENDTFTWLICEEILAEYKEVLRRLGVRRGLIGAIINLLREEAEVVEVLSTREISPDPADNLMHSTWKTSPKWPPWSSCSLIGTRLFRTSRRN